MKKRIILITPFLMIPGLKAQDFGFFCEASSSLAPIFIAALHQSPNDDENQLVELLKSEDFEIQIDSIQKLQTRKELSVKALRALADQARNAGHSLVENAAIDALAIIGEKQELPDQFVQDLQDSDIGTRASAALVLGFFGKKSAGAVPQLIEILKSDKEDSEVKKYAVLSIGHIGSPQAEQAIPHLYKIMISDSEDGPDNNEDSDFYASVALAQIGKESLPYLRKALSNELSWIRLWAVMALESMGPLAASEFSSLVEVVKKDEDSGVKKNAMTALLRVGEPRDVAEVLTAKLEDEDARIYSAELLFWIGPDAKSATPALVKMLKQDHSWQARYNALIALSAIGTEESIRVVIETLGENTINFDQEDPAQALLALSVNTKAIAVVRVYLNEASPKAKRRLRELATKYVASPLAAAFNHIDTRNKFLETDSKDTGRIEAFDRLSLHLLEMDGEVEKAIEAQFRSSDISSFFRESFWKRAIIHEQWKNEHLFRLGAQNYPNESPDEREARLTLLTEVTKKLGVRQAAAELLPENEGTFSSILNRLETASDQDILFASEHFLPLGFGKQYEESTFTSAALEYLTRVANQVSPQSRQHIIERLQPLIEFYANENNEELFKETNWDKAALNPAATVEALLRLSNQLKPDLELTDSQKQNLIKWMK